MSWIPQGRLVPAVVSKHFKVDVALGRVGVATEGRTSQLGGSIVNRIDGLETH